MKREVPNNQDLQWGEGNLLNIFHGRLRIINVCFSTHFSGILSLKSLALICTEEWYEILLQMESS